MNSGGIGHRCYLRFCVTNKPELSPWFGPLPEGLYGKHLGRTPQGTAYSVKIGDDTYIWYGPEPRQTIGTEGPNPKQRLRQVKWGARG